MISDIDIGTEYLRWMGELRFFIGILKFIFFPKTVSGTLKLYDADNITGDFTLFCASNVPWISSDFKMTPLAKLDDKYIDVIFILNKLNFFDKIGLLINCLKGTHLKNCKYIHHHKVEKYSLTPNDINNPTSYLVCD